MAHRNLIFVLGALLFVVHCSLATECSDKVTGYVFNKETATCLEVSSCTTESVFETKEACETAAFEESFRNPECIPDVLNDASDDLDLCVANTYGCGCIDTVNRMFTLLALCKEKAKPTELDLLNKLEARALEKQEHIKCEVQAMADYQYDPSTGADSKLSLGLAIGGAAIVAVCLVFGALGVSSWLAKRARHNPDSIETQGRVRYQPFYVSTP
eukprot:Colp12_sorted_trinity150504_noHs@11688